MPLAVQLQKSKWESTRWSSIQKKKEEEAWEVKEIRGKSKINGETYYQVKWRGWPMEYDPLGSVKPAPGDQPTETSKLFLGFCNFYNRLSAPAPVNTSGADGGYNYV
jgi:hypothetical protein